MSSIRHLLHWLRHDTARFRDFLICWVVLALVFFFWVWSLNARILTAEKLEWEAMRIFGWMLFAYEAAVVVLILSSDPLLGANEHWKTLPIPVWLLPVAKLLLVAAVFLVLPALLGAILIWQWGNPNALAGHGELHGPLYLASLTGLPCVAALCVSARTTGVYGTLANAGIACLVILLYFRFKDSSLPGNLLIPLLLLTPVAALFYVAARCVRATSRVSSVCQALLPITLLISALRIDVELPGLLRGTLSLETERFSPGYAPKLSIPARHAVFRTASWPNLVNEESLRRNWNQSTDYHSALLLTGGQSGRTIASLRPEVFQALPAASSGFAVRAAPFFLAEPYAESPAARQFIPFRFALEDVLTARLLNQPIFVTGTMRLRYSSKTIRMPLRDGGEYSDDSMTLQIRRENDHDGNKFPDYYGSIRHRSPILEMAAFLIMEDGSRLPVTAGLNGNASMPLQHGYHSTLTLRTGSESHQSEPEDQTIELHVLRPGDYVDVPVTPGPFAFHNPAEPAAAPASAYAESLPLSAESPETLPGAIHRLMIRAAATDSLETATRELNALSRAHLPALLGFAAENAVVPVPSANWDPLLQETLCRLLVPEDLVALRADPALLHYLRPALQAQRPDLAAQLPAD